MTVGSQRRDAVGDTDHHQVRAGHARGVLDQQQQYQDHQSAAVRAQQGAEQRSTGRP
jgi:hypothetical protein